MELTTAPLCAVHESVSAPSNSEFLAELARAAPNGTVNWVHTFHGNPDRNMNWGGALYDAATDGAKVNSWTDNTYYSVAALGPDAGGHLHRRKANFSRLLSLVVDDVEIGDLMGSPTYVLETSPGKRQVGFFLDGNDDNCADLALVTRLVTRMAETGLLKADKSGNNAVRWVRLPGGTNQKPRDSGPFVHVVHVWSPQNRYSLEDAAACLGIDLDELRAEPRAEPASNGSVAGSQDEKLRVLTTDIIQGNNLHDSTIRMAASLVATGMHCGAIVNLMRGLMESSLAPRDERWRARYDDIARSVMTAQEKFAVKRQQEAATAAVVSGVLPADPLFVRAGDLLSGLKPIQWLIKGILETDALSMLFGPSGSGKSYLAIDFGCSVATGSAWMNHPTRQGPVFYVAGEGHNGIARRMAAWQKDRGISLATADLYKSKKAVQFLDKESAQALAAEIEQMVNAGMPPPQLVIIDTLARNFGDGDENSAADASRFIENVDSLIRKRWLCNVTIVHHTGHVADRARGSTAFRGAVDQELSFSLAGSGAVLSVKKMKDGDTPADKALRFKKVVVGYDEIENEDIESAVLELVGDPFDFGVTKRINGSPLKAREVIDAVRKGWTNWVELASRLNVADRTLRRALSKLADQGILEKDDGYHGGFKVTEGALAKLSMVGGLLESPAPAEVE